MITVKYEQVFKDNSQVWAKIRLFLSLHARVLGHIRIILMYFTIRHIRICVCKFVSLVAGPLSHHILQRNVEQWFQNPIQESHVHLQASCVYVTLPGICFFHVNKVHVMLQIHFSKTQLTFAITPNVILRYYMPFLHNSRWQKPPKFVS